MKMKQNKMAAPMGTGDHGFGVIEPPYCKLKNSSDSFSKADLSKLLQSLEILSGCHQQHEKILSEAKFLQLMIFNRNNQLRKEKSIQLLKRVQACLKRFHIGTKLYKHTSDLYEDTKSALNEVNSPDGSCFVPAKQIWVFTLYILQKYVELLRATATYCVIAYEHLSCHFSTGMLIPQMLLFMGTVSRIWILSKTIKEKAIKVYGEIFQFLKHIPQTPSQWVEPPLLPSIKRQEDAPDSAKTSRTKGMLQMASADSPTKKETKGDTHFTNSSQNDEEDLGEPISLKDLRVDENSNVRKRKREDEIPEEHSVKKKKLEPSKSKKMEKLLKKKLLGDKGLSDLPLARKKKKKNSKVDKTTKVAKLKSKNLNLGISEEKSHTQLWSLESQKEKKSKSKEKRKKKRLADYSDKHVLKFEKSSNVVSKSNTTSGKNKRKGKKLKMQQ